MFGLRRRRTAPDPLLLARIEARRAVADVTARIGDTVELLGNFSSTLVGLGEQLTKLQAMAEDMSPESEEQ